MATTDQFKASLSTYNSMAESLNAFCNVLANKTKLGIAAGDMTTFNTLFGTFETLYAASVVKNKASSTDRAATQEARKLLTKFLRLFVQKWFYKSTLAEEGDLLAAGLKLLTGKHSPYGTPTMIPVSAFAIAAAYTVKGKYWQDDAKTRAKPNGVKFARVYFSTEAKPSLNPAKWSNFMDFTRSPFEIVFDPELKGLPLVLAMCFVGTNGAEGKFGTIRKMTVPTEG